MSQLPTYPRATIEVLQVNGIAIPGVFEAEVTADPAGPRYVAIRFVQIKTLPDGTEGKSTSVTLNAAQLELALSLVQADYVQADLSAAPKPIDPPAA